MAVFIGTDEAGYGPNLGPLVITATAWRFPDGTQSADCWELLAKSVSRSVPKDREYLHVGDSKQVYASGRSIERLEHAVLSILALREGFPADLLEFGRVTAGCRFVGDFQDEPCRTNAPVRLPVVCDPELVRRSASALREVLAEQGVGLIDVRSCILFPVEFNRRLEAAGTKGQVLSSATLKLVADIVSQHDISNGEVICDKHGGRNRYDGLLSEAFDDRLVFRLEEGRPLSRYRLDGLEVRFQTKAESHFPVAVASMVSKYAREAAMMEFNAFWKQHIPDVKPTLGYPVDAARFMNDIADTFDALNIDRAAVWRVR